MQLRAYSIVLVVLPLSSGCQSSFGYWDVVIYRRWAASGYRFRAVEANYSLTGSYKHSSWSRIPGNGSAEDVYRGSGSTETIYQDGDFVCTLDDWNGVQLKQSVTVSGQVVDVTGSGKAPCKTDEASRGCSGATRINATCVGERCANIECQGP